MSLLFIGEDPWLLEYESCQRLQRDIMEQLTERQQYHRTSDKYNQISANIRLRLKQYNNEVGQLTQKLNVSARSDSITSAEVERRTRQIEELHSKGLHMQKKFNDQGKSKLLEDRDNLMDSKWNDESRGSGSQPKTKENQTIEQIRADQKRMLGEQEQGLDSLAQIISRQKDIANTISNEVDFHNEILDDLGTQIDRTDHRVRTETQHISVVDRKDKTCIYWVFIILLFLSIIIVAAI
ncbi:unnamed protein product [Brassicogethes aeneus]|uniref:t-SNARE coiled-coil homology domain-containing protein n=1 Tax=Brassicogethes aeneus TaxID=1431903 RepID=A0A9P0FC94_BRAAE|nr:unnamed protein product [Brassicogethes aeneus]